MERKYSVAEIDRMRVAIGRKIGQPQIVTVGYIDGTPGHLSAESETAIHRWKMQTEDQLRTYMLAGVGPEDVEKLQSPQSFRIEKNTFIPVVKPEDFGAKGDGAPDAGQGGRDPAL